MSVKLQRCYCEDQLIKSTLYCDDTWYWLCCVVTVQCCVGVPASAWLWHCTQPPSTHHPPTVSHCHYYMTHSYQSSVCDIILTKRKWGELMSRNAKNEKEKGLTLRVIYIEKGKYIEYKHFPLLQENLISYSFGNLSESYSSLLKIFWEIYWVCFSWLEIKGFHQNTLFFDFFESYLSVSVNCE